MLKNLLKNAVWKYERLVIRTSAPEPAPEKAPPSRLAADPHAPGVVRFDDGYYAGHQMNLGGHRPLKVTERTGDGGVTVANIRVRSKHFTAHFEPGCVERVTVQHKYGRGEGHAIIRFTLREDQAATLVQQTDGQPKRTEREFVFQIHAVFPQGVPFSYRDASKGRYNYVHELATLDSMFMEEARDPHSFKQYVLDLTDEQKHALLLQCVETGAETGVQGHYEPLFRNCITEMIRPIDAVVDYGRVRGAGFEAETPMHPSNTETYLRRRSLIAKVGPELQDEFDFQEEVRTKK